MIQHLHDGERVANLVRDFGGEKAERRQLFVLTQVLLDIDQPLVKAGFFDGDSGQFRERRQDADFLIRELVRLAGVNAERADRFTCEQQRNTQQRDEPFLAGDVHTLVPRRSLDVFNLQGFEPAHDDV